MDRPITPPGEDREAFAQYGNMINRKDQPWNEGGRYREYRGFM
jgi:hypothetical protein